MISVWALVYLLNSRPISVAYVEQFPNEQSCKQVANKKKQEVGRFDNRDFICAPIIKNM